MRIASKAIKTNKRIKAREFDELFDQGKDISSFLDLKKAAVVQGLMSISTLGWSPCLTWKR